MRLFTRSYIALLAANFLLFFGFWLLIPILPFYLRENYHCPEAVLGAVLSCYTVSELCVRPFSGYIMDSFPRKPIYIFCYFLCVSMFLGYVLAGGLTMFIILRTLHGAAFGGVTVGGNTLVVDVMPAARRGEGLGYYGLTNNVSMALGPMAGLFMHGHLSYEVIFLAGFATSIAGLLLATTVKTAARPPVRRAPVSLDRFFLLRGIPASVSLLLLSIPYGSTTNFVAMYAQEIGIKGQVGCFFTIMACGMGISRLFAGRQVDRGRGTTCILVGFVPVVAAFLLLSMCRWLMDVSLMGMSCGEVVFFIVPALLGVGFGTMFPAFNTLYINLAPNNQRATATSTYLTAWDVGLGIGIALSGVIAQHFTFYMVYLVGALLSVVSLVYFSAKVTPHYHRHKLR